MAEPYYVDKWTTIYLGDHREVLPSLERTFDLIVADPPYGETSLDWDRWPQGWPDGLTAYARSMWCFGSMRMFLDRASEFASWKFSQDVVWEKHNGSNFAADRFRRVHEHAVHWYRGDWSQVHHVAPRIPGGNGDVHVRGRAQTPHTGKIGPNHYTDDGLRITRSVIYAKSMHRAAINETEKPVSIVSPLIEYGCQPGGLVLDPFAGSCSTAMAARAMGRHAVCIEKRESQCEAAARRLSQGVLDFGESA